MVGAVGRRGQESLYDLGQRGEFKQVIVISVQQVVLLKTIDGLVEMSKNILAKYWKLKKMIDGVL